MLKDSAMNCIRVRDLLPDYSVELLDPRTSQAVDSHLDACEECRHELRVLNAVVTLVEEHGALTPPVGLFNAVRNRIESGDVVRERPAWWAWLYSKPARFGAMGMATAALALALLAPVSTPSVPAIGVHPEPGGQITSGAMADSALGDSIRQHMLGGAEGPLADRVAREAMAEIVTEKEQQDTSGVQ
jgi:anti-sigma factor RsiW